MTLFVSWKVFSEEILSNLDIYEDLYITKINLVNNDNVIMNYQCSIKSVYTDNISEEPTVLPVGNLFTEFFGIQTETLI